MALCRIDYGVTTEKEEHKEIEQTKASEAFGRAICEQLGFEQFATWQDEEGETKVYKCEAHVFSVSKWTEIKNKLLCSAHYPDQKRDLLEIFQQIEKDPKL